MERKFSRSPRKSGGPGEGNARPRKFSSGGPRKFGGPSRFGGSRGGAHRSAPHSARPFSSTHADSAPRSHAPSHAGVGERPRFSSRPGERTFSRPTGGDRPFHRSSSDRPRFGGSDRPRFTGGRGFGGGSRFSGRSSGGRSGGRSGGKRNFGAYIDPSKFIRKASGAVHEEKPYIPKHQFVDFEIVDALKKNIIGKGYKTPTPIQDQSIPHVLKGKDIVGIANTGTGKTGAFLIPLIDKVIRQKDASVLIIVPTRELATQIEDELHGFTRGMGIYSAVCIGGAAMGRQMHKLRVRNHFVIGTPGRLKDLVERRALRLNEFSTIVLDEADRMLDMGFIHDMQFLMGKMPKPRHTLFFSATLSPEIEKLIHQFLTEPVRVMLKVRETSDNVDQDVVRVTHANKYETLVNLLKQPAFKKVLIFGQMKHSVERLSRDLVASGIRAESIHGDKTQGKRQKSLDLFRAHHVQVLVATDVAARGLDISDVTHVINYDQPSTYEDYVHRIGRTGRAGKKGHALTFIETRG